MSLKLSGRYFFLWWRGWFWWINWFSWFLWASGFTILTYWCDSPCSILDSRFDWRHIGCLTTEIIWTWPNFSTFWSIVISLFRIFLQPFQLQIFLQHLLTPASWYWFWGLFIHRFLDPMFRLSEPLLWPSSTCWFCDLPSSFGCLILEFRNWWILTFLLPYLTMSFGCGCCSMFWRLFDLILPWPLPCWTWVVDWWYWPVGWWSIKWWFWNLTNRSESRNLRISILCRSNHTSIFLMITSP